MTIVFGIWPYVALTVFVVGHVWRWRYDQYGWTTRTSELMEKRWLLWASPIFHVGVLFAAVGHFLGLVIPASATTALGVSEHAYHLVALGGGIFAGTLLLVGFVLLMVRRFVAQSRLRLVTVRADIVMYVLVGVVAVLGMTATVGWSLFGGGYDYRATVAVWFRSVFWLHPQVDLMAAAPLIFQLHGALAFGVFAVWPFTRLVHLWSIPLAYFVRPPIVYQAAAAR